MHVRWSEDDGPVALLLTRLKRRVSALTDPALVRQFKIGITADPERRARRADYDGRYDEMVVLYGSRRLRDVQHAETVLIDHNWDLTDNLASGGGGATRLAPPPYFVYLVRRFRRWRW